MNFEKLDVWQRSARRSAELYKATNQLRDFSYRDQLTRSTMSFVVMTKLVPANQSTIVSDTTKAVLGRPLVL